MKKISVIVPTYNEERNIKRCLSSLEMQTIPREDYEIIVVDGRSRDNTVKIAKKIADRVFFQKSKRIGGARNDGIRIAKAGIVATTDADCIVPKDWLERIIGDFKDQGVVCVFGPIKPIEKTPKYRFLIFLNNFAMNILYTLRIFNATIGSNTAFRKKDFLKAGGYLEVPAGDDYEISFRMKKMGKIKRDGKICVDFSMRRLEKFGAMGTLKMWAANSLAVVTKKESTNSNYNQQTYD